MTYSDALRYTQNLLRFGIKLGLERFAALLERLGNPQQAFPCVHIAGTNGKGSTTVFTASILQAAGYKVGRYLSPHLFDLRERIAINGTPIPEAEFATWVECIRPHIEALAQDERYGQTTEFELLTAVAFCYFAEKVDIAVLEVGLGGRYDATNVIPAPLVSVITQIGLDHQAILGDTVGAIAAEKAGILKAGTLAVTGVNRVEALEVIEGVAAQQGVPLYRVVGDSSYQAKDGGLFISIGADQIGPLRPKLEGAFQHANAAVAATATHLLNQRGMKVSPEAIRVGLEMAWLPGRFQVEPLGDAWLILDVAHNHDAAEALSQALQTHFPGQKFVFIVGLTTGHGPREFLKPLKPFIARLLALTPSFRPRPAEEVYRAARHLGIHAELAADVPSALRSARPPGASVVVTGSFYVVGEVPKEYRQA